MSEVAHIILGAVAAATTSAVVITGLLWPSHIITRKKPLSNLIYSVCVTEFLGSIGLSMGFPIVKESFACKLQGFLIFSFYALTCVYTSLLSVELMGLFVYQKLILRLEYCHAAAAIVFTILQLSQVPGKGGSAYGSDDHVLGKLNCLVKDKAGFNPWYTLFYIIIVLSSVTTTIALVKVSIFFKKHTSAFYDQNKELLYMSIYPITMIVLWFPASTVCYVFHYHKESLRNACLTLQIFRSQYGTLVGIYFFVLSLQARKLWADLIFSKFGIDFRPVNTELIRANLLSTFKWQDASEDDAVSRASSMFAPDKQNDVSNVSRITIIEL